MQATLASRFLSEGQHDMLLEFKKNVYLCMLRKVQHETENKIIKIQKKKKRNIYLNI